MNNKLATQKEFSEYTRKKFCLENFATLTCRKANSRQTTVIIPDIEAVIRERDQKEVYIYHASNVGKTKNCLKEMSHFGKAN